MSVLKLTVSLLLAALFAAGPGVAATGSWNGVAFTAWNAVAVTSWNGTSISTGGGGLAAFSDDFDRADSDSLGPNWTEADGDADIHSNTLRLSEGGFGENFPIYTGEACTTVNQYVLFVLVNAAGYPQIPLRYTNSSSPFYFLEFSGSSVDWYHKSQIGGTSTQVNAVSGSISVTDGITLGMTVTGTGNSTEVKVWTSFSGGYSPSDPTTWGAATVTFTDNPASPVDTGGYVGLGGVQGSADTLRINNFYGGDVP